MPLPAVPDTVRDLDADVVIEVLSRHAVNVSEAARELEVNSADLRRLLWARPQLAAAAAEMEERRLDIAERNILEALTSDDPRMRMASAMFTVRYSAKARKRGWITNSSASVDANAVADPEPKHYRVVWSKPDEPERELAAGEFVRDGRILSTPSYGGDRRDATTLSRASLPGHRRRCRARGCGTRRLSPRPSERAGASLLAA